MLLDLVRKYIVRQKGKHKDKTRRYIDIKVVI